MPDDIARAEEECMERLKSKIQVLETSYDFDTARLEEKCERLQKQLKIAVAGLQYYANEDIYIERHQVVNGNNEWTSEVMLDNGVKASYFLKKIEGLSKWQKR